MSFSEITGLQVGVKLERNKIRSENKFKRLLAESTILYLPINFQTVNGCAIFLKSQLISE